MVKSRDGKGLLCFPYLVTLVVQTCLLSSPQCSVTQCAEGLHGRA